LIAAVTDSGGTITGVHRTWLDPAGGKAPVDQPRRALGHLIGNGVRFGAVTDVMVAAEGIETALAVKMVMPAMPVVAALSAGHLAALIPPLAVRRLYVACNADPAGYLALARLRQRFHPLDIELPALMPLAEDFNADLLALGPDRLRVRIAEQLAEADCRRFITSRESGVWA